jgi:hypothetical protein
MEINYPIGTMPFLLDSNMPSTIKLRVIKNSGNNAQNFKCTSERGEHRVQGLSEPVKGSMLQLAWCGLEPAQLAAAWTPLAQHRQH